MDFTNVTPGMACQPESSGRYNALNALLRNANAAPASTTPHICAPGVKVDIKNMSDGEIAPFTPVKLGKAIIKSADPHIFAFEAGKTDTPFAAWGISTGTIPQYAWGEAVISGVTPACFAAYQDGTSSVNTTVVPGECATVCKDGLISAGSGNAQIIAAPQWVSATQKWLPGVITIGSWLSTATQNFNVYCTSLFPLKYQITRGTTPFPGHAVMYDTEINGVSDSPCLCLVARYTRNQDGATQYSCTFEFIRAYQSVTGTMENAFVFLLATCYPNGKVIVNPGAQESVHMRGWLL